MKICVFNHDSTMSGAPSALYDWVSFDKDDEFLIIVPKILKDTPFKKLENVKLVEGKFKGVHKSLDGISIRLYLAYIYESSIGALLHNSYINKSIKEFNPKVIITNTFACSLGPTIATSLSIPHIWHIREHMESDLHIAHFNEAKIKKLASKSYAIFISKTIKEYYEKRYKFLDSRLIYDQVMIGYNKSHDSNYFNNNEIHMMIAGSIQEGKGQLDAIKVIDMLNKKGYKAYLDIYGGNTNKYYDVLVKYINDNNVRNVTFKGFSNNLQEDRLNYDIALICSRNEGFGRVTVESMYAKNITIGLDAPATNEIIKDGVNGYLYKKDDIDGLCRIIEHCFNNKDEVIGITNKAKEDSKEYLKPIYKKITEFCKEIVNSK